MSKTPTYNMPRDDSPRGSPRGSVGSNEGDLSFENHDVDNDRFSTRDFGDVESKISADIENYNELDQNPIFRQLCAKNKFEDKPTCKVCSKSFKFMTKKKNCKFCGGCICEEHGKKKRPNPTNTTEYVRICDICDELHIQKTILSEFKEKLDKKLEALEKYQREINEQQFKINDGQKELDDLTLKKSRNDKNYSEQMTFLTNDIAKGKEETRKCEKDNAEMTKELQKTQKKVEELDTELVQTEQEFEKLSKEGVELTNQIEALNMDIAQMSRTIRNMEEVASQNKALQAAAEAKANATATANKNRATSDENIVIPSMKSVETVRNVETVKNVETSSKDESTVISPSPSENRTSISRVVEPEELAPEKSEAKSSMIENQSKRSMAKSSMSQAAPRMVKTSMIRNKGETQVKEKNCNVECNLF